jgi:hypothetical protein
MTNPLLANIDERIYLTEGERYKFSANGTFGSGTFSIEYEDTVGSRQTVKHALTTDGGFSFTAQGYKYYLVLTGATAPSISYDLTEMASAMSEEEITDLIGAAQPTISVADASAMQTIIDTGTVQIGQLFSLVSDRSVRRYEGNGMTRIVSDLPQGNPTGYFRATSVKTSNITGFFKHDGTDGATGLCYSVDGGTPVYTAVAADTQRSLTLPHNGGAPVEITVWPATSASSGRVGNLTHIQMFSSALTSVDVSGLAAVEYLNIYNNQLTSLDVSGLTALEYLSCNKNQLTSLDVSGLSALETLYCDNNQLTSLDVSGLPALLIMSCQINQLASLDVSGLPLLHTLNCYDNQLTSLDLSDLTALIILWCYDNQLTSLSLGSGPFETIEAHDNPALTDFSVGDDFDAYGGYSAGPHGIHSQNGVTLHNTALSGATLNAFYQKLTATPSSGYYGAGFIYLKNVQDPATNPCVGWDSDDPSLAPVAWTIYGT